MRIDLESLKQFGAVPRVHGNGFIQLDLVPGGARRLHIWGHPELPRQKVDTGIHNHRFDFTSECIRGRIINAVYTYHWDPELITHIPHAPVVREGEDTVLSPLSGRDLSLHKPQLEMVPEGQSYFMDGPDYHETFSDRPSATVMIKHRTIPGMEPTVLVPVGQVPDNDFNRNAFSEGLLWRIIVDVLG